jgi:lipoprotein-anchoring transpeptidase ErfK/SrfK
LSFVRALLPPLSPIDRYADGPSDRPASLRPLIGFGRSIQWSGPIRKEPDMRADKVGALAADSVVPLYGEVESKSGSTHNKLWYEVPDGYIHSALVHVVEWQLNTPVSATGDKGFWAELTVPHADPRVAPSLSAGRARYRYYGGTVYKVMKVVKGADAASPPWWYQIEDESFPGQYFLPGQYLRPIPPADFKPLSPGVDPKDKKLVVKLGEQRVYAYEKDRVVFTCRAATGAHFEAGDFSTPVGTYFIYRKTPTQHMYGGAVGDEGSFDLPGIGWVSYFTSSGIAFHGTYWHNDYGVPRSHGCVNVTSANAKWIWQWSMPPNDPAERYITVKKPELGTTVVVQV